MADPAHVLKNIQGQFINSTVFSLGDETVARHQLPTSDVKLDYVEAVIDYDSSNELKVNLAEGNISICSGYSVEYESERRTKKLYTYNIRE